MRNYWNFTSVALVRATDGCKAPENFHPLSYPRCSERTRPCSLPLVPFAEITLACAGSGFASAFIAAATLWQLTSALSAFPANSVIFSTVCRLKQLGARIVVLALNPRTRTDSRLGLDEGIGGDSFLWWYGTTMDPNNYNPGGISTELRQVFSGFFWDARLL